MKEIGEILKAKRLEKGLTIEQISQQTRLSLPHIKAIEAGNLDYFKNDLSYLRFFLHAYSDVVGADYEQIKMLLNKSLDDYTRAFEIKKADDHIKMEENIQKNKKEDVERKKRKRPAVHKHQSRGKLDFSLVSFLTIVTILAVCVLTVSGYYLLRNLNQNEEPNEPIPPVVENENDKPTQQEENEDPNNNEETSETEPLRVELEETNRYMIYNAAEKIVIRIEFVPSSWFLATMDGVDMRTPVSQIYDAGSTLEIEMDPAVNQELKLRFGYFAGMQLYVNDEAVEIDSSIAQRPGTQDIYFEIGGNTDESAQ